MHLEKQVRDRLVFLEKIQNKNLVSLSGFINVRLA